MATMMTIVLHPAFCQVQNTFCEACGKRLAHETCTKCTACNTVYFCSMACKSASRSHSPEACRFAKAGIVDRKLSRKLAASFRKIAARIPSEQLRDVIILVLDPERGTLNLSLTSVERVREAMPAYCAVAGTPKVTKVSEHVSVVPFVVTHDNMTVVSTRAFLCPVSHVCQWCLRVSNVPLQKCARCKSAIFCDEFCQKIAFNAGLGCCNKRGDPLGANINTLNLL